jgi:hypothetical protein
MGALITLESVEQVRAEIYSLLATHWHEVGQDKERMHLDPDWDGYMALERCGQLKVFAARMEGKLVGYATFFTKRHLHYRSIFVAINDLLFLLPAYRKSMTGFRFIADLETLLISEGVKKIFFGVKAWHDFGPVLNRLGYAPIETTWAKWVGD